MSDNRRILLEVNVYKGAYETKLDRRERLRIFDTADLSVGDVIKARRR